MTPESSPEVTKVPRAASDETDDDDDVKKPPPRKCRDLFRLYNDAELIAMRRLENLERRRQALRLVLSADYAQENNALNALGLCYGTA